MSEQNQSLKQRVKTLGEVAVASAERIVELEKIIAQMVKNSAGSQQFDLLLIEFCLALEESNRLTRDMIIQSNPALQTKEMIGLQHVGRTNLEFTLASLSNAKQAMEAELKKVGLQFPPATPSHETGT